MNTVTDHYQRLLAPIYLWMAGGAENALALGASDLAALGVVPSPGGAALDLGAGFGMHAIPLARLGYSVTAVDSSSLLLSELDRLGPGLGIQRVEADLLDFESNVTTPQMLILCMGDTLTHLPSPADVNLLCSRIARALVPGGRLVTTFRDYSRPAAGDSRFIPVRSDTSRIHTCFLEGAGDRVLVHDIIHERMENGAWNMRVSHYPKLRLHPDAVVSALEKMGLDVTRGPGPRGMVQISAVRRA